MATRTSTFSMRTTPQALTDLKDLARLMKLSQAETLRRLVTVARAQPDAFMRGEQPAPHPTDQATA